MSKEGRQAIAVIDLSNSALSIHNVPDHWDIEQIEDHLNDLDYHLMDCSWGAFDGEINDER
jgi:hypothetical protein